LRLWVKRALPVVAALIGASAALAEDSAAPAVGANPVPPVTYYWHNWTDGKGVSHLTRCPLSNFELQSLSPPAAPEWANRRAPGTASLITVVQPSGWKGVWHQESKVYWTVTLTGRWFVEAMDGTRVELGPGDVSLGEDQNTKQDAQGRKGHRSGNIGEDTVTLLVIELDVTPTVDQPCRFK
jgi:hypothetical protein